MEAPFFNLVVPTKNRANTLYWTLRALLQQDYPHYQIVVSDNCSEDNTADLVAELQQKSDKIRYFRTPQRLSMASNYEYALSKLEKGYVLIVGDDDALVAQSLSWLAPIIQAQQPEAFIGKRFTYYWDSYPNPALANQLIESQSSDYYYWQATEPLLREAAEQFYLFNFVQRNGMLLPALYHGGCVSLQLIRRIQASDGRFFNCQFPDYYSAMRVTAAVERFLFIETPYFITGASGNSTGVSAFLNQKDQQSEFQQFQKDNDIPLDAPLVFCHSFALFTAEAILKAQKYSERVVPFRWERLLAVMFVDAMAKPNQAQYEDVVQKMRLIAEAKGLTDVVARLVKSAVFRARQAQRTPDGLDNPLYRNYTRNLDPQQFSQIEQVARYAMECGRKRQPVFLSNPEGYFRRWRMRRFFYRVVSKLKRLLGRG